MSVTNRWRENTQVRRLLSLAPTWFLFLAVMQFVVQAALMRFLLYHQQYEILPAESYQCQLFSAEDYRKLTDRSLDTVALSDGTTLTGRTQAWYDIVLPQIKRIDDNHYVEVTTLGTAHYFQRWLNATIPICFLCLIALAFSIYSIRMARADGVPSGRIAASPPP